MSVLKARINRVYNTDPDNLLLIFSEIGRLATQNAGDALAKYTGGEKVSFAKLSGLERVIAKVGDDLHTQYLLSFQASASEEQNLPYHYSQRYARTGRGSSEARVLARMNARPSAAGFCSGPDFMDGGNYRLRALEHDNVPTVRNNDLLSLRRKARLFSLQFVENIPELVFNFLR